MSGIRKKFFFQLVYAFSQLAFPLITYPYITRKLGAEGLGLIGYVEYVSGFIIAIASFGIPFFGVREVAKLRDQPEKKRVFLRQLFSIHLLVSIIGCAVFVGLIKANQKQTIPDSLLGLGCANIMLPAFIAEWFMQGTEAFVFTTVRGIVLRFAGLIALFVFVTAQQDYIIYYLIIVSVQAAVAISNMAKTGVRNFIPSVKKPSFGIGPLWHFFLTTSIISLYVFFDVMILGWIADEAHVGYYTIAIKIVKLSLLMVLSLSVILFPRISYLQVNSDHESIKNLLHQAFQFVLLLTLPLAAIFFCLAPEIIQLLAGPAFIPSIWPLQILCILPLVIGMSNLFCYQIIIPFGGEKKLLLSVAVTCVFSLGMHYFLAINFLERGTALATILTEMLMMVVSGFFAWKIFAFKFPLQTVLQSAFAIVPFIIVWYASRFYIKQPFALIIVTLVPGMISYLLLQLFVFKNSLVMKLWEARKHVSWRIANG